LLASKRYLSLLQRSRWSLIIELNLLLIHERLK
jgi:hypothetical protein